MNLCLMTFIAGIPTAWAFGRYTQCVVERKPFKAALWDLLIILLSSAGVLTAWAESGNDPLLLVSWAAGNAIGTYLVVRR